VQFASKALRLGVFVVQKSVSVLGLLIFSGFRISVFGFNPPFPLSRFSPFTFVRDFGLRISAFGFNLRRFPIDTT
jgi:hypothetical protein